MPFHQSKALRYYTFDIFDGTPLTHAVFTRQGGVSPEPYAQLNLSISVGDVLDNVVENRLRCFAAAERPADSVFDSWLVHGSEVVVAEAPRKPDPANAPRADILLTENPEVTLLMRYADCVPILLFDPARRAIGLVHAGWQGMIKKAPAVAVQAMVERFGSVPADILAAVGPSIGPHHYEIGPEVVSQVELTFGENSQELLPKYNGATHFDLWESARVLLKNAGVLKIEMPGICTACHPEDWFSHRGEGGRTGRFGVLIGLQAL